MKAFQFVGIISTLVWVVLPYFYRKHNNFYFFLFLAFTDISSIILWHIFSISSQLLWFPINYLMLFALNRDFFVRYIYYILLGIIPVTLISYILPSQQQVFACFLLHLVIFIIIFKQVLSDYLISNRFKIYYMMLSFYILINLFKFLAFMREITIGIEAFYVGTFVQIFIGIILIYLQLRNNKKRLV